MTVVLGIETATQVVGVGLRDDSGLIGHVEIGRGRRHVETLAPAIEFLCAQAQVRLDRIGAIAIDVGPGLFTGLRVGAATAVGLALALGCPVIPVLSLDVLAHGRAGRVASVIDARRGEVYVCSYIDGVRVGEPCVLPPSRAATLLDGTSMIVGDGPTRYPEQFAAFASTTAHPSASGVLACGALDQAIPADQLQIVYLRAPDAQINWQER